MVDFKFNFLFEDSDEERDVFLLGSCLEVFFKFLIVCEVKEILI